MMPLETGELAFSVEARVLRELGERLVKTAEVALIELVKNAYDADATKCELTINDEGVVVADDGLGMTLDTFRSAWMTVGTGSKERSTVSPRFKRQITGEKGIGRFAVRFLGESLRLRTVADDPKRGCRTVLTAAFHWSEIDAEANLASVHVPFRLERADRNETPGTRLEMSGTRRPSGVLNRRAIATSVLSLLSPFAPLISGKQGTLPTAGATDPGFRVRFSDEVAEAGASAADDLGWRILDHAPLRARLELSDRRVRLTVESRRRGSELNIVHKLPSASALGRLFVELRYFPKRKGTMVELPVDGRRAFAWVAANAGVAVFDRGFRVRPYGDEQDDWLQLNADHARSARRPRSSLAKKYFDVTAEALREPKLNYMLKLPNRMHLIGVVSVASARGRDLRAGRGLIPAADREGFVANEALTELRDYVRSAVEALAFVDFEQILKDQREREAAALKQMRAEARRAIRLVERSTEMRPQDRAKVVAAIKQTVTVADQQAREAGEHAQLLEMMGLMGVTAGFMTHEFGEAVAAIERSRAVLRRAARTEPSLAAAADEIDQRLATIREFGEFVRAMIASARPAPAQRYHARPRVLHVVQLVHRYATDRGITIENELERGLFAPPVPQALYTGVVLNLITNALKAVARSVKTSERRVACRAWEQGAWHVLQVSDTGVGVPDVLRERVFEPLFTTTDGREDPLGSGMGLGLAIVRRAVTSFGGKVAVVRPPGGFSTCFEVRLPLKQDA